MTTSTTARRHTAAGPNPGEHHVDYRTLERLLTAVHNGDVHRDENHEYVDRGTGRNVTTTVYAVEERGHLALTYAGGITVTDAGVQWLNRDRHPGPAAATADVTFQPPAAA